jgi:hypothetical protein
VRRRLATDSCVLSFDKWASWLLRTSTVLSFQLMMIIGQEDGIWLCDDMESHNPWFRYYHSHWKQSHGPIVVSPRQTSTPSMSHSCLVSIGQSSLVDEIALFEEELKFQATIACELLLIDLAVRLRIQIRYCNPKVKCYVFRLETWINVHAAAPS